MILRPPISSLSDTLCPYTTFFRSSDVARIRTRARKCDGGYILNGGKIWCTNASLADFVTVAAKTGEGDQPGSINFFIRSEEDTSELQSLMRISYAVYCLQTK